MKGRFFMQTRYINASLTTREGRSEIECIQLNTLMVCIDKIKGNAHLVYNESGFADELKRMGYEVIERDVTLATDETSFNELKMVHYELQNCTLYIFNNLAVKADESGLETFCKERITVMDVIKRWNLKREWQEDCLMAEYNIPKNEIGRLAVKVEQLQFDGWDMCYRAPGEIVSAEERLENIDLFYSTLSGGGNIGDDIADIKTALYEHCEHYEEYLKAGKEEDKGFYENQIKNAKKLIQTTDILLDETKNIVKRLKSDKIKKPKKDFER